MIIESVQVHVAVAVRVEVTGQLDSQGWEVALLA